MRALVCSEYAGLDALVVGDLPDGDVTRGTVRVDIEAAGVNFPDVLVVQGLYQDRPPLPFAPGFEIAGRVTEVGDDVTHLSVGDRVFGYVRSGGFAETAVVDPGRLFPVPDGMPASIAAALPVTFGTALHALVDRACLGEGETMLVLGAAGGVGLAAVQIGRAVGARVVAAVSSDDKARAVEGAGASEVIRYDRDDLRATMREMHPAGVDVVFDPVGGQATESAFRSLGWGGRHLVIGFAAGEIPSIPANLPLLKGASLVGVFWGRFSEVDPAANRANFDTLTRWWAEGTIDPLVSETFPLERAVDALVAIGSRRAIGKLVVEP